MRIDLTQAAASQVASEPNPKQVNGPVVPASDVAGSEDRTTLTSTQQSVSALVSKAMSSPDIRQDLVDKFKQAIDSGQYKLDPEKIASSMIDEHA
jgi:negative regulator of flagellin synthesis FlgM